MLFLQAFDVSVDKFGRLAIRAEQAGLDLENVFHGEYLTRARLFRAAPSSRGAAHLTIPSDAYRYHGPTEGRKLPDPISPVFLRLRKHDVLTVPARVCYFFHSPLVAYRGLREQSTTPLRGSGAARVDCG